MNEEKLLPISEAYPCIQGEGKLAGVPSIMIRMQGCRLRCMFKDSICDTWYSSWQPEKGTFTFKDIRKVYEENNHIQHTIISGGGPTLHKELLPELCEILSEEFFQHITVETEGSEYVDAKINLVSLSPKLRSSVPRPGEFVKEINRVVTNKDKEQHDKYRCDYKNMRKFLNYQTTLDNNYYTKRDYQVKFVICTQDDLEEVEEIQRELGIGNQDIYLMPEGIIDEQLQSKRKWLMELCRDTGYNYTDRLHILAYGNRRGV